MPARPAAVPAVWYAANPLIASSWATSGESEPLRAMRSRVNFTSAALIGVSSSKRAPGARWKVKNFWSGSAS
jgi:hypothetical protein